MQRGLPSRRLTPPSRSRRSAAPFRRPTATFPRCSKPSRPPVTKAAQHAPGSPPCRAKRILVGQLAVLGALGLAMFLRELPGLRREIRIWRMIGFGAGSRHPR
ncbi:hypothetical protein ABZY93_00230 [Streptomyces smyrnaeus]|uniref:hypothetical protein n=1 Tax=Streptomyces smyrnaeus TaxID=1387713 RepID=UPI0033A7510C